MRIEMELYIHRVSLQDLYPSHTNGCGSYLMVLFLFSLHHLVYLMQVAVVIYCYCSCLVYILVYKRTEMQAIIRFLNTK